MLSAISATPPTDHLFKRSICGLPFFLGLFRILQAMEYLRGLRRAAGDDGDAPGRAGQHKPPRDLAPLQPLDPVPDLPGYVAVRADQTVRHPKERPYHNEHGP